MDLSTHDKWLLSHECLSIEEWPPLHKETVHLIIMCDVGQFHRHFMGKCALHRKACITLQWNAPLLITACNMLYNLQILTRGNQARCFMYSKRICTPFFWSTLVFLGPVKNVVLRFSQPNWFTWHMPCYCCGCGCSHMFVSGGDDQDCQVSCILRY
jgi:hypothetical protein